MLVVEVEAPWTTDQTDSLDPAGGPDEQQTISRTCSSFVRCSKSTRQAEGEAEAEDNAAWVCVLEHEETVRIERAAMLHGQFSQARG